MRRRWVLGAGCWAGLFPALQCLGMGRRLLSLMLLPPLPTQFIYDMWYGYLTPDREFPAEASGGGAPSTPCLPALRHGAAAVLRLPLRCPSCTPRRHWWLG